MQRTVQHLRLRAPSAAAARAALPVLEDALRCASLPDDGERLLLVRHLALGRVDARRGPQALALLIEQRVAQAGWQWVPGGTPEAATAQAVWFASGLQARVALSLALLGGTAQPTWDAWYWPLAVPEAWRDSPHDTPLQRIVHTLATAPAGAAPAATQLAAWVQAVLHQHRATEVAAQLGPVLWAQCLQAWPGQAVDDEAGAVPAEPGRLGDDSQAAAQGLAPSPAVRERVGVRAAKPPAPGPAPPQGAAHAGARGVPPQQRPLARPAVLVPDAQPAATPARATHAAPITPTAPSVRARALPPRAPGAPTATRAADAQTVAATVRLKAAGVEAPPTAPLPRTAAASTTSPRPAARHQAQAQPAPFGLQPTRAAGLLFLLPVLVHLRLVDREDAAAGAHIRALLAAALRRLRVPVHDAAWQLVACPPSPQPSPAVRERGSNTALPLAPSPRTRGEGRGEGLPPATPALRRWLRQHAQMGLARLVLRPGLMSLTPTHVDLHFELAQADVRIRRLGLDISPGWDAAYGRVVAFHYDQRL